MKMNTEIRKAAGWFFAVLSLFLFIPSCLLAQSRVSTHVVDSKTGAPLACRLQIYSDTALVMQGDVADDGVVNVEGLTNGANYTFVFGADGYEENVLEIRVSGNTDIGKVALLKGTNRYDLGEATVSFDRVKRLPDRMVAAPSATEKKRSFDGYALLSNMSLPLLEVDESSAAVTSLGTDVSLYINGKPASAREVKTLRPENVARVEFHNHPTGEFAGERAALNFITDTPDRGGQTYASATQWGGYKGDWAFNQKIFAGKSQFNIAYTGNYNRMEYDSQKTDIFTLPAGGDISIHTSYGHYRKPERNHVALLSYGFFSDSLQLDVEASFSRAESPRNTLATIRQRSDRAYASDMVTSSRSFNNSPYASLFYKQRLKRGQALSIHAAYTYSRNRTFTDYRESANGQTLYSYANNGADRFSSLNVKANYTKSLGRAGEAGLSLWEKDDFTRSAYWGTDESRARQHYGNTFVNPFYNVRFASGFYLQAVPGFNYCVTNLRGVNVLEKWNFQPQINVAYTQPNGKWGIDYALYGGNGVLSLSMVSNASQSVDDLQELRGNPFLYVPRYWTNTLTGWAKVRGGYFTAQLNYEKIHGNIRTLAFYEEYADAMPRFVSVYKNDGDWHDVSLTAVYNAKYGKHWQVYLQAKGFYDKITGSYRDDKLSYALWGAVSYSVGAFRIKANAMTTSHQLTPQGAKARTSAAVQLMGTYTSRHWNASVFFNNPGWNNKETFLSIADPVHTSSGSTTTLTWPCNVGITLACTFSYGKKHDYREVDVQQRGNSSLLK